MSTQSQITANQSNAQKSTGPKSEQGKAIASQNNFRYGFTGAFRVLAWENEVEFQVLLDTLHAEHQPSTPTETVLVDKMAQSLWLSKRAVLLQDLTFNIKVPLCDDPKQLALYLRYQTTHDRAFHKSLSEFLKLRAEKRKQEIGFESQQRKQAEETRRKARHESRETRQQNAELRKQADHIRREAAEKRRQDRHYYDMLLAEGKVSHQQLQSLNVEIAASAAAIREKSAPGMQEAV